MNVEKIIYYVYIAIAAVGFGNIITADREGRSVNKTILWAVIAICCVVSADFTVFCMI